MRLVKSNGTVLMEVEEAKEFLKEKSNWLS
jgi:hypothetical protein